MSRPATAPSAASSRPRLELLRDDPQPASERSAAVIDLGSNSWRLVAYRYMPHGPWRRIGQLQEPVRIARGLAATGHLDPERSASGLEALEAFVHYARTLGVAPEDIDVVATSAFRDAEDGPAVVSRAAALTGLPIRTLTAADEGRYGYLAAVNSTTLRDGLALDLGGGSLQLVRVRDRAAAAITSWPLGAVRVTEELLAGDRATGRKQLKRARAAVRRRLAGLERLPDEERRIVGIGGSVRSLAGTAMRAWHPASPTVQGHRLHARELRELIDMLARRPPARRALPGIKAARADIILGAALVLEAVLELTRVEAIELTRAGLREGVFFASRLFPDASPVIDDVRAAAVRNVAAQQGLDLSHAEHVAELALGLRDSLAEATASAPKPGERELLWAAAMLHGAGKSIDVGGHAVHARYVLVNSELYGYAPREVALIAQIVRYHCKGAPGLDGVEPLAGRGDRELVARCALLLRLAAQLAPGPAHAIDRAHLVRDGDALALTVRGDDRLARWTLARHVDDEAFSSAFGRRLKSVR